MEIVPLCIADCDGKECGDDGCGGSCGSCSLPEVCKNNTCGSIGILEEIEIIDPDPQPEFAPIEMEIIPLCIADCDGKSCGDDGCGGSCGSCFIMQDCVAGVCTTKTFEPKFP